MAEGTGGGTTAPAPPPALCDAANFFAIFAPASAIAFSSSRRGTILSSISLACSYRMARNMICPIAHRKRKQLFQIQTHHSQYSDRQAHRTPEMGQRRQWHRAKPTS